MKRICILLMYTMIRKSSMCIIQIKEELTLHPFEITKETKHEVTSEGILDLCLFQLFVKSSRGNRPKIFFMKYDETQSKSVYK